MCSLAVIEQAVTVPSGVDVGGISVGVGEDVRVGVGMGIAVDVGVAVHAAAVMVAASSAEGLLKKMLKTTDPRMINPPFPPIIKQGIFGERALRSKEPGVGIGA